ncbi:MAG TPA: hypothetical protein P5205_03585 [Candidatus Paceibacterota bacterium]|nr:hypothetical protein [Verrucomicrobiota bacterium]HSA09431.1 hypothetical protein [Candidatus Paceibacterota bacterium]
MTHDAPNLNLCHADVDSGKITKEWLSCGPLHEVKHRDDREERHKRTEPSKLTAKRHGSNQTNGKSDADGKINPPSNWVSQADLTQCKNSECDCCNRNERDTHG